MSNFTSLNTALTGLRAAQLSLDTVSNNVANANTPGYTRQRVNQSALPPYQHAAGTIGTGVGIDDITRVRDGFLDARLRATSGTLGFHDTLASLLQRTEQMMSEPENGLTAALGGVWDALDDLALDPAEPGARRQVLSALEAVAANFREIDAGWGQLAADTQTRLEVDADEVNSQLGRLSELNKLIPEASFRGTTPTDLLDERDRIVDDLSKTLGVQVQERKEDAGGTVVDLRLGNTLLVEGKASGSLSVDPDGSVTLHHATDGSTESLADLQAANRLAGGEIGALHHYLRSDLPARRESMDRLAGAIAEVLNEGHAAAWRSDGATAVQGGPLLAFGDPPSAANLQVAITQPEHLATALRPDDAPADWLPAPNDGTGAEAMAELRYARVAGLASDVDPDAGARTLDDRLRAMITTLARDTADSTKSADAAEAVHNSARVARQSVHGVSIDEEMAALVQYQRALEASSRVMTTIDEALDVLVNRTGLVGR